MTASLDLHERVHRALGSYLAGSLEPAERTEVEQHLVSCSVCREAVTQLAPLPGLLGRLCADDFALDEPEADPELLPEILSSVRRERRRDQRRVRLWRATTGLAAAAAVAAFLVGAAGPQRPAGQQVTLRPVAATTPLSGRATLVAKPWGTSIELQLAGLPAGVDCVVYTVGRGGHRHLAGSWGPTPDHTVLLSAASSLPRSSLTQLVIATTDGRTLLTALTLPQ